MNRASMNRTATAVTHLDADTIASDVEEWLPEGGRLDPKAVMYEVLDRVNQALPLSIQLTPGVIEYNPAYHSAATAAELVDGAYSTVGPMFEEIAQAHALRTPG